MRGSVGADVLPNAGTSMLDLVESVFIRNGIQSLRYDGSMSREAREYVLLKFRQPGGPKVILIRFISLCLRLTGNANAEDAQYEVWWHRLEPHLCQPHHQVSPLLRVHCASDDR